MEEERAGAVIDLVGQEQAHDIGQSDLDRVGVLEGGEGDGSDAESAVFFVLREGQSGIPIRIHANVQPGLAALGVIVTTFLVAQGGRTALSAVDFNMLTATDIYRIGRHFSTPWEFGSQISVFG
jgi:hypothetical protein